MARLKSWYPFIPPIVAAVMLIAFLPGRDWNYRTPADHSQRRAVERAVDRLEARISERRARESLLRRAERASTVTHGALTVVYVAPVSRADAESFVNDLMLELAPASTDGTGQGRVVVYLATWDSLKSIDRSIGRGGFRGSGMVGPIDEPCVATAETLASANNFKPRPAAARLGSCALVLALGRPGPMVTAWTQQRSYNVDPFASFAVDLAHPKRWGLSRDPCADPVAADCTALIRRPTGTFLAWMQRDRGASSLARFWKAEGDVESAVRSATGLSLAEALPRFVHSEYAVPGGHRKTTTSDVSRAGVTVLASLLVAMILGRRRRVG